VKEIREKYKDWMTPFPNLKFVSLQHNIGLLCIYWVGKVNHFKTKSIIILTSLHPIIVQIYIPLRVAEDYQWYLMVVDVEEGANVHETRHD